MSPAARRIFRRILPFRHRGAQAAISVSNQGGAVFEAKTGRFARLIARGLADHRISAGTRRGPATEFVLEAVLHDLQCQLPCRMPSDLAHLRVQSTLCVTYRLCDATSGAELDGRTLAFSEVTPPIVRGTTVGSDAVDRMLEAAANAIVHRFTGLPLAL